jgi:two-component system, cell cycle sensor histidine kinase and response regulator CckA
MTGKDGPTAPDTAALIDTLPGLVWHCDAEGRCTRVNARWATYSGASTDALFGDGWLSCVHADDRAAAADAWAAAVREGRDARFACRLRRHDGAVRWFETTAACTTDAGGRPSWALLAIDVDDGRAKAEADALERARLEADAQAWQRAVEQAGIGIARVDAATNTFIAINDAYARIRGVSRDEMTGQSITASYPPEWHQRLREKVGEADRTGHVVFEAEQLRADGTTVPVHLDITVVAEPGASPVRLAFVSDMSAQKRAEATATLWERVFEQADLSIALAGTDDHFVRVNPAYARERGYEVHDLAGQPVTMVMPEDERARRSEDVDLGRDHVVADTVHVRRDGTRFPVRADVTAIHDESGAVVARVGFFQDLTAQKEVERYVAGSPAVIFALRVGPQALEFLWSSANLKALTGFDPAETDSLWWHDRLHPHDAARVLAAHTPPYDRDHLVLEYQFRHRDGHYIWMRDEKRLLRDAAGRPLEVIGSWVDVTARVELEQQFRQAQKMEAVGRLAGGIAHDFNNLLTVIQGYGELLATDTPPLEDVAPLAQEICMAATRAAGLTRQLLTFSRKQVLDVRVISLHQVVSGVEKLLRRLIGEDVALVTVLDPATPAVLVDVGQMEQVVINLAVNARDAMPTGGRLTITTGVVDVAEAEESPYPDRRPGRYARLTVTDTGRGMTADVKTRIFEPFYTTKEPGKGTGLGLPIVFGVVKQLDGYIDVWSEPGQGARFTIDLPVADPGRVAAAAAALDVSDATGTETVLLVEDEDRVRGIARLALEARGYRVIEASSGDEGLALAREQHFDLLLTDVVMPGMSGPELVTHLRAERHGLKVIFMSGYTDDALTRYRVAEQQTPLLQKPFTPRTLAKKVRDVLDSVTA